MKYFKNNNEVYAYDEEQILQGYGSDMVEITLEEVNTITQANQEEAFNSLSYAQKRVSEYPPITDYLDGNEPKDIPFAVYPSFRRAFWQKSTAEFAKRSFKYPMPYYDNKDYLAKFTKEIDRNRVFQFAL